jgi:chromosome segregation ATPase
VRYEEVQQAIDELLARGESPSVQKVREVLGTGSFTTISDHLRAWRGRRLEHLELPPPQGMPEALRELAEALWERARAEAGEALARYRDEADHQVAMAREEVAEARRQAEDAGQRESALASHLAGTEKRLQEGSAALARSEASRQALEESEGRLAERLEQLQRHLARLEQEREREADDFRSALAEQDARHLEALTREEQRHETAEARLISLLDDSRHERREVEKRHAGRERQRESRIEELQQQGEAMRGALAEEAKRHRETDWARARAEEQSETLRHEGGLQQARIDEQKGVIEEQARRLRELETRLDRHIGQPPLTAGTADPEETEAEPENDEGPAAAEPSR